MLITALTSLFYGTSVYLLNKKHRTKEFFGCLIVALGGHFFLLFLADNANIETLSVMSVLSLISFFMVLIASFFVLLRNDNTSYFVAGILAAICIWAPLLFSISFENSNTYSWHLKIHIAISIAAYISLSFAALYSILLIIKDNNLKKVSSIGEIKLPLDYIEKVMLRFSILGLLLLTVSLITGVVFIHDILLQQVSHKLVFSSISWIIVAGLLIKHLKSGFRGRKAAIWLLTGFVFLVFAYFGSSFILQVILK